VAAAAIGIGGLLARTPKMAFSNTVTFGLTAIANCRPASSGIETEVRRGLLAGLPQGNAFIVYIRSTSRSVQGFLRRSARKKNKH
jgi:hypothetical protein